MKRRISAAVMVIIFTVLHMSVLRAQNDIQLSQQLLTRVNYNPAATGASNYTNIYMLARQQWVGFNQAPRTQVINAHNYFRGINAGLGASIVNDKLGYENSLNAKLAYAYHIQLKRDGSSYLSLGLGAGLLYKHLDVAQLVTENPNDATVLSYYDRNRQINPDFDFGVELNVKDWQIGASSTHLNLSPAKINNLQSSRHFYAYTKYNFDLNREWKFVPTLMGINSTNTFSMEANGMFYYKDRVWFGGSYRTSDKFIGESIIGMAGLLITDFLKLGYSYDYNIGPVKGVSGGSHEIMLSFRFAKKDDYGRKTPRFFE